MSAENNPEISIIVPVYKSRDFLSHCLDSISSQTFTNFEVIMVDDGSPDDSGDICDSYAARDSRFISVHQENRGAADALNHGTRRASGEYIMYLDADDWLESYTFEAAIKTAREKDADVVIWSYYKELDKSTEKDKPIFEGDQNFEKGDLLNLRRRMIGLIGEELREPLKTDAINSGWGKLYKSSIISSNNILWINTEQIGSSDVYFNVLVFSHIVRASFICRHLNHYRKYNQNSLTRNYQFSLYTKQTNLFRSIKNEIETQDLGQLFEKALSNRIALSIISNTLSMTNPKLKGGLIRRVRYLKGILYDDLYRESILQLEFGYLPLHWKLFFYTCKKKFALGVFAFGIVMRYLK